MNNKILRIRQVIEVTGLSRSSIYLKISRNEFPAQIKLGVRAAGWYSSDIENWVSSLR